MKVKIKVEKEVEAQTLVVKAKVRHWEGSEVNGVEDTEDGDNIPCKSGEIWSPIIDINTGKIINWPTGTTASIHYKVCDSGSYYVRDENGLCVLSIEQDYVPTILCPKEQGYGDYIIMDIDENGMIQNWKTDLSSFIDEED